MQADLIVLSVPYEAQEGTIAQIVDGAEGKVVISVVAPLKPPKVGATVWRPPVGPAAQEAQAQLGQTVQVVAAFQNIAAGHLKDSQPANEIVMFWSPAKTKRPNRP